MNTSVLSTKTTFQSLISNSSSTHTKPKQSSAHLPSHVKYISSPSNPFVNHCLKLRQSSSYRHSHGSVIVVGTIPIREISRFQESRQEKSTILDCLLLLDDAVMPECFGDPSGRVIRVSSAVMSKLSGLQCTDSIEAIAVMNIPKCFYDVNDNQAGANFCNLFSLPHRVLVLDGIQDPGNLGTLLRSAMAFGWDGVFLLPGCCDPFNDKALRASRGASFQIPIISGSWVQLEILRNKFDLKMLAGHPESNYRRLKKPLSLLSRDLADSLVEKPVCLILGSEGHGLSEKSKQDCDELVSISMDGEFESLNVSVAGGIFLFMLKPENRTST